MDLPVNRETVCVPSPDVVVREIEGDLVIVPLVAGIGDADDELYTLNEHARAVWEALDGRRTLAEVAAALARDFEAADGDLEADVVGFAAEMVRRGILTTRS